jgi:indole-3-glycerol phosphate synthase
MTFLADILARKRVEVDERRQRTPDAALEAKLAGLPPTRSLFEALSPPGGPVQIISEVKRASPSVGRIDSNVDAAALAADYASAGAAAISILTDGPGFGGSLEDLSAARRRVQVPLLRKDFVLDRYQLLEARLAGADAALLIVAALPREELARLMAAARELSLDVLVEVHDEAELEIAHAVGSRIIGVNNRNLKTFHVDLATSERLIPRIDRAARAVAESGVKGPDEVRRLRACGASNFLVGEALVRASSPAGLLRQLREISVDLK